MKGNKETEVMCRKRVKSTGKAVKRKTVMLMMAVMLIIISFAGCGNKKEETKAIVADESKTISEEDSGFDFSQVFDNIEIDGKRIPFPFTLNELGDDFDIDMIVERGDGTCGATLMYKNEMMAHLDCVGNKKSDIDRDAVIFGISLYDSSYEKLYVNGINCKNNLEDVRQSFTGLTESVNEAGRCISSEAIDGEKYILITYREDTSIRTIYIDGPKK